MTYATQSDLVSRFGEAEIAQLSDRTNGSVIDADVVARAIADAQAEIDGYLGKRYALPLATVPAVLVRICCDIARYYLSDDAVTEAVRKRYEDAIRLLRGIGSGDVTLDAAAPPAQTTGVNNAMVVTPSRPRVFGGL